MCHKYEPDSTSEGDINKAKILEYKTCSDCFSNLSKSRQSRLYGYE